MSLPQGQSAVCPDGQGRGVPSCLLLFLPLRSRLQKTFYKGGSTSTRCCRPPCMSHPQGQNAACPDGQGRGTPSCLLLFLFLPARLQNIFRNRGRTSIRCCRLPCTSRPRVQSAACPDGQGQGGSSFLMLFLPLRSRLQSAFRSRGNTSIRCCRSPCTSRPQGQSAACSDGQGRAAASRLLLFLLFRSRRQSICRNRGSTSIRCCRLPCMSLPRDQSAACPDGQGQGSANRFGLSLVCPVRRQSTCRIRGSTSILCCRSWCRWRLSVPCTSDRVCVRCRLHRRQTRSHKKKAYKASTKRDKIFSCSSPL